MHKLAREMVEEWAPITNKNCKGYGWKRDGQSASCGYCGSMSVEEVIECLSAVPRVTFELADSGYKVYIDRYPHAGDCPKLPTACYCTVKIGGGPIKFYSWHLFDGGRSREEAEALWRVILVECRHTHNELMARMRRPHESVY